MIKKHFQEVPGIQITTPGAAGITARFALVKSLVKIPPVAAVLCKDDYDAVVTEAIAAISREAS